MALEMLIPSLLLLQSVQYSLVSCSGWIDMSHLYDNETFTWGTLKQFQHSLVHDGKLNDDVPYFLVYDITLNEHSGTHIDAPAHFAKGKWSVDQIPPEKLVGKVIMVNITAKASEDRNAELTVADLEKWEKEHGRIPDDSVLLVLTGWGKYWRNYEKYFGTPLKNSSLYQFPGIHKNAAQWLVDNRKIKGVGIDTASIDSGQSNKPSCHQIFYAENIYGLENVANVDKLPAKGARIYVMPMNIKGGSGAPVRIFASTNVDAVGRSSKNSISTIYLFYLVILVVIQVSN